MCDHCGCREFAPIAELTADHEQILSMAWSIVEAVRAGRPADVDEVGRLVTLLDAHAAKEEFGLYPELMELGELTEVACAVLEEEHRTIRAALVEGHFDRREYYALSAHIEVEEMELFSAAGYEFEEPEWVEMAAVHNAVDSGDRTAERTLQ